jgi:hypothetical protein
MHCEVQSATVAANPDRDHRDPLADERERARQAPDGAEVTDPGDGDAASHTSLGSPPRRDESRPVFRSSQLQQDEDKPEDAPPLRG